jgi:hypothetical protein
MITIDIPEDGLDGYCLEAYCNRKSGKKYEALLDVYKLKSAEVRSFSGIGSTLQEAVNTATVGYNQLSRDET